MTQEQSGGLRVGLQITGQSWYVAQLFLRKHTGQAQTMKIRSANL
jgi:hypothetical protein